MKYFGRRIYGTTRSITRKRKILEVIIAAQRCGIKAIAKQPHGKAFLIMKVSLTLGFQPVRLSLIGPQDQCR